MGDSQLVVISDDDEVKLPKEVMDKETEDGEELEEAPDWLPDGWIMEVYRGDDGTLYRYYTSPVSDFTFMMKSQVLNYLFSEMDERFLESKDCATGSMLLKKHEWLPKGWLIEVRAGGEKMNKMYKFYVCPEEGVRLFSKEDVILYANDMKISPCDTNGQCNTCSTDNILATVEFNPSRLPEGWVKEVVFRKAKEGVRKDPYYTDPISQYVFRTLKSAMCYLQTGKITKRAFIQKTSVHDLYSFDKCTDLHESLRKRLRLNLKADKKSTRPSKPTRPSLREKINCNDQTSYSSEDGNTPMDSDSPYEPQEIKTKSMKTPGKEARSSKTIKRPSGRPWEVEKQTNGKSNRRDLHPEREEYMVKTKKAKFKEEIKQEIQ